MVTIPLKIQLSKNPVKSKHESESIPHLGDEGILLERLSQWTISGIGLHPGGSNYVFVVRLIDPEAAQLENVFLNDVDDLESATQASHTSQPHKPAS